MACTDYPGAQLTSEFIALYPDAKVSFRLRNPVRWTESIVAMSKSVCSVASPDDALVRKASGCDDGRNVEGAV